MTTQVKPRCLCSTVSYEAPEWSADYYPDNCPVDWRLGYFMNDFPGVYLPAGDWAGQARLASIIEEMEGEFSLVLEWPPALSPSDSQYLLEQLEPVSHHVASLVVKPDTGDPEAIMPLLRRLRARYPVSVDSSRPLHADLSEALDTLGVGRVWRPEQGLAPHPVGSFLVVVLPIMGLRQVRAVLEQLSDRVEGGARVGLFIDIDPGAPQHAREVRTLIELLGLA